MLANGFSFVARDTTHYCIKFYRTTLICCELDASWFFYFIIFVFINLSLIDDLC